MSCVFLRILCTRAGLRQLPRPRPRTPVDEATVHSRAGAFVPSRLRAFAPSRLHSCRCIDQLLQYYYEPMRTRLFVVVILQLLLFPTTLVCVGRVSRPVARRRPVRVLCLPLGAATGVIASCSLSARSA